MPFEKKKMDEFKFAKKLNISVRDSMSESESEMDDDNYLVEGDEVVDIMFEEKTDQVLIYIIFVF